MSEPLFLDSTISLEKVAYDTKLDAETEEWPVEVVRESYKQLPFLKSFETEVEFDKMDTARGFAVGKMLVWPARMPKTAAAERKQLVTVPLIVRNREMSPLDVFTHEGAMKPMDQDKVAAILFRPEMFEKVAPRDQFTGTNLSGQLTPPNTDHQYNAGNIQKHSHVKEASRLQAGAGLAAMGTLGGVAALGAGFVGRAQGRASGYKKGRRDADRAHRTAKYAESIWSAALPTFRSADINAFGEKLASSPPLKHAYGTTPVLRAAIQDLMGAMETDKTAAERRDDRLSSTKPTVVQVREAGKNYSIKTANRHCYEPLVKIASRFDVQKMLSHASFQQLLTDGRVTLTVDPVQNDVTEKTAQAADRFGVYQVSRNGAPYSGIVIPKVVDFDGRTLDMQVFAGLNSHSLQEKVAGVFAKDITLKSDEPRGMGVFVYQEGPIAVATEPVRIEHKVKVAHEHGSSYTLHATRMSNGTPIKISVVPGIVKVAMIGNEVAIPPTMRFVALNGKQALVSATPAEAQVPEQQKVASSSSIEVVSDGSFFEIRGANAAAAFKHEIMTDDEAEFALCALGLTGSQAQGVMKTAAAKSSMIVPQTHRIVTEATRGFEAMSKVASVMSSTPVNHLRMDLTEELAILTSPAKGDLTKVASVVLAKETVDTILSLGFVTPENASLYVNYIPELEKVSSKLAELLVASRLGMDDVREQAAKNAMTQMNAVVRGLETLRERIS